MGRTLDDIPARFDWTAVAAIVNHAREDSSVYRAKRREQIEWAAAHPSAVERPSSPGDYADWSQDRHIATMQLDELRWANWWEIAKNAAQAKKTPPPQPKPSPRPGVQTSTVDEGGITKDADGTRHVGSAPIPAKDFARWWAASQDERDNWEAAA